MLRKDATKPPPTRLWQRGVHKTPGSRLRLHGDAALTAQRTPPRLLQALPAGEMLPRLRYSIRKPVGDVSSGNQANRGFAAFPKITTLRPGED